MSRATIVQYLILLLLIGICFGCNTKKCGTWSTAKDLATADLKKCNADPSFYLMRKFSLEMNPLRKEKGIPLLPEDFHGIVFTTNNQVRWINPRIENDTTNGEVYIRKDLEWNGESLRYDRTSFYLNDSLDTWVTIEYSLDTGGAKKDYKLVSTYGNKYVSDSILTKNQADTLLSKAFATYDASKK